MKVASFTIDHDRLLRGIYVSRKDSVGSETVTTFDVRIKRPNIEPPVDIPAIHTLEHLLAVYLRSDESGWADKVIYVGPMGCRTGMYLIFKGDLSSKDVADVITKSFEYVRDFEGIVPATTSKECWLSGKARNSLTKFSITWKMKTLFIHNKEISKKIDYLLG